MLVLPLSPTTDHPSTSNALSFTLKTGVFRRYDMAASTVIVLASKFAAPVVESIKLSRSID